MTETRESLIEERLAEFPEAYAGTRFETYGRGVLGSIPESLFLRFRAIASQSTLEDMTHTLTCSVTYCVVMAARLSGRSAQAVAVDVRKRASGWLSLAGAGEGVTSRMMASGFQSAYEMGVGNLARLGVRAYRWETDRTGEAAEHLIKIAGAALATALHFEAVKAGLPSRNRGKGEQLTLF